jgi:signal transduction histidine kinase
MALELTGSGVQVILRLKDAGIVIAEQDIPKIFSASFRTDEAKELTLTASGWGCISPRNSWKRSGVALP